MDNKTQLSQAREKKQINWGVLLFQLFVRFAAKQGTLPSSQAATLHDELMELGEAALGEDSPKSISDQLNHYIGMVNLQIKQNSETKYYVPFPSFSFAVEPHLRSAVLDQLDMMERTLTEAAEAGVLDWDRESGYFAQILTIFTQVENESMQPVNAMARLIGEIKKLNQQLPKESFFPLPDLSAYE